MTYIRSRPILIGNDDKSVSLMPLPLSGIDSTAAYGERIVKRHQELTPRRHLELTHPLLVNLLE